MKKFIIAMCGMLVIGCALAVPEYYYEPTKNNEYETDWKVVGKYDTDLIYKYSDTYPQLEEQYGYCTRTKTADNYRCDEDWGDALDITPETGTHHDEKAIVLDIARKIFKNGAKFCTTQIQASNSDWGQWAWLSYFHNSGNYNCKIFCKYGYDPDTNCEEKLTGTSESNCQTDYEDIFTSHPLMKNTGESGKLSKDEMEVFDFKNETGSGTSNQPAGDKNTKHIVLGIVKRINNGIVVAPIEIWGRRGLANMNAQSWVRSASTNDATTTLCVPGYKPTENETCEQTNECKQKEKDAENDKIDWCPGYTYYNSEQHNIKISYDSQNKPNCRYYRCKQSNYGWKENTNHKCDECTTDAKSGIFHGACITCPSGQVFTKNTNTGCKPATPYTQKDMQHGKGQPTTNSKKCWMETDPDKFYDCVTGESQN